MKKYLLLLAAAATLLTVSCVREKGDALDSQKAEKHAIDDSTPMPVIFTSQYLATKAPAIETKGLGAIDDWHGHLQQLHIYGYPFYRVGEGVKAYEWIDYEHPLMANVAADAPTADSDHQGVRLDGSQRAKINVYNALAIGNGTWDNPEGLAAQEPYYYRENNENGQDEAFSFFAYFVDDAIADPDPTVTSGANKPTYNADGSVATQPAAADHGKIVLEGLKLDGTQDIMLATTDKEVDALARSRYFDQETYQTLELTDDDLGEYVDARNIYSAHAARRGINPDLIFEHQLARVTFHIKKGGTVPSSDITVAGIDLFDYYEGTLTIADGLSGLGGNRGLAPVNTGALSNGNVDWNFEDAWKADLAYQEQKNETMNADYAPYVKTVRKADDINTPITAADKIHPYKYDDGHYDKFGQSVLVYPGRDILDMVLRIEQEGATALGYRPYKTHLEIKNDPDQYGQPVKFEAGKNYNVYLTVYGLEEVRISVSLTEWDAAEIYLDPDADDEDLREPAQILLGTDRDKDPAHIISHIGAPVNAAYEDENGAYLPFANPAVVPHGELTIRSCDKFDLLSTQMFVKGDPDATPATQDHYEEVLAYVRSNSNGVFHFSIEGVDPTYDDRGLRVYENAKLVLTEDGVITPKDTTKNNPQKITVRQNSSNDFLAAVPRVIELNINPDDRVPVRINWNHKTGEAGAEPAVVIVHEEGGSNTLLMNASFTIDYDKDGNFSNDVTYLLDYDNVGDQQNPVWGWQAILKVTGTPLCGPGATTADLEAAELAAYKRFDLAFEVTEGKDKVRVDPATGDITPLAPGDAKVKMSLSNLANDETYQPCDTTIKVKVVCPEVVISNVPDVTIKYGEKITFKPVISAGGGAISYASSDAAKVDVGADNGIALAKGIGTATITVTVADSQFYQGKSETFEVTVEAADPVVTVESISILATDANVDATPYYTVVAPKYASEGIDAYNGTITYESSDANVFTVADDGKISGVGAGRAVLTVKLAADGDKYNAYDATISVKVNAVANSFDLAAAANVNAGASTDAVWTAANGAVTLNAVTKADIPVPSFGAKFSLDTTNRKINVAAGVAVGEYVLTLHAAGDAQHLAATKQITLTIEPQP